MSEEEKKRASTWMFLQEGPPPENALWQDAIMAVWKEHVAQMMI